MAGLPGNVNGLPSGAVNDLGLGEGLGSVSEDEKKKKLMQAQRERMGLTGTSVFGAAASSIFGDMQ